MAHSHKPRRRFGQNFLCDEMICQRIVDVIAPEAGQLLVEIGPGLGALTWPILPRVKQLHVVEIDRDLIKPLTRKAKKVDGATLHIHHADALQFDFAALCAEEQRLRVFGNLPYNISTPLLFHLLTQVHRLRDMHFMLQKEVALRLAAAPGSKAYGRLSVMVQAHCDVELLFDVLPEAFSPAPEVTSAIVRINPKAQPLVIQHPDRFATLVRMAFSQRRKNLGNALKHYPLPLDFAQAGVEPTRRAESLTVAEFIRLSDGDV